MNQQNFYSHGKLMITGEYLALAGGLVLAIPLKFGQSMMFEKIQADEPLIRWTAIEQGRVWYEDIFRESGFEPGNKANPISANLQKILVKANQLNQAFPERGHAFKVTTEANFPLNWGLGSSSTLISNLAWWADVNPFKLLFGTMGGSGYDIACARSDQPIIYRFNGQNNEPSVSQAGFDPPFAQNLWFVYTGRKQSSAKSIEKVNVQNFDANSIARISELTLQISAEPELGNFIRLVMAHEALVAGVINQIPLQKGRFADFQGAIKSLGAWGGDFCMAASAESEEYVRHYFADKGCHTLFGYSDMVLKQQIF